MRSWTTSKSSPAPRVARKRRSPAAASAKALRFYERRGFATGPATPCARTYAKARGAGAFLVRRHPLATALRRARDVLVFPSPVDLIGEAQRAVKTRPGDRSRPRL